jgi:two-component system, NarL family, nitrate/nitrite response regulator NarL
VVADRQEMYLEALSGLIAGDPWFELVGTATLGTEALSLIRALAPDVAVLDPSLTGIDGIEILAAIERDGLATSVVLLSAEPEERRPYAAIGVGARCYLTRCARPQEILGAIVSAAAGVEVIDERLHPALLAELRRRVHEDEPVLDPAIREVIELTAAGLNPSEVAAVLQVSATTVKSRLRVLYRRFDVGAATAAVAEAVRRRLID